MALLAKSLGNEAAFPMQVGGETVWVAAVALVDPSSGQPVSAQSVHATELDTDGNPVPTYKAHSYTYDGSGNLATDTVTDGADSWVRSYGWANGAQTTDSGWVKQ